jgi:hypothetical protein
MRSSKYDYDRSISPYNRFTKPLSSISFKIEAFIKSL